MPAAAMALPLLFACLWRRVRAAGKRKASRLNPNFRKGPDGKWHLFLRGTGGLYHYMFGVLARLEEVSDAAFLRDHVILHTVSGSAFATGAWLSDQASVPHIYGVWCRRFEHLLGRRRFPLLYRLIEAHAEDYARAAPPANQKIYVSRGCHSVGVFAQTREQYNKLLVASAYYPFLTGCDLHSAVPAHAEGYMDGSLSCTRHCPEREYWFDIVAYLDYRSVTVLSRAYWKICGFFVARAAHLYERGYRDAELVLPVLRDAGFVLNETKSAFRLRPLDEDEDESVMNPLNL